MTEPSSRPQAQRRAGGGGRAFAVCRRAVETELAIGDTRGLDSPPTTLKTAAGAAAGEAGTNRPLTDYASGGCLGVKLVGGEQLGDHLLVTKPGLQLVEKQGLRSGVGLAIEVMLAAIASTGETLMPMATIISMSVTVTSKLIQRSTVIVFH